MIDFHIFVISWVGQHENAVHICRQALSVTDKVTLIHSEPDLELPFELDCKVIKRPIDTSFWGDKFSTCLAQVGDDAMLVIHADCQYPHWPQLINSCQSSVTSYPQIGVWSPHIDWVPWQLKTMIIASIAHSPLKVTAKTDSVIFYLAPSVIARMKLANYEANVYGWGIEWMMVCAAYTQGLIAVTDTSIKVMHPNKTGYPKDQAHAQLMEFNLQLLPTERILGTLLNSHIAQRGGFGGAPK